MNRHTDLSRLRPSAIQGSHATGAQPQGCDAIERAAALLTRSMQQSDGPIAELSGALARMAQTLSDIGTPLFGTDECEPAAPLRVFRDTLARDVAVCIQSLQFHDRLTQQLTQARNLLTESAPSSLRPPPPATSAHESAEGSVELF